MRSKVGLNRRKVWQDEFMQFDIVAKKTRALKIVQVDVVHNSGFSGSVQKSSHNRF